MSPNRFQIALFSLLSAVSVSAQTPAGPLQRGLGPEPDSIDIHQAQGLSAINLLRDVREGLYTFDAAGDPVFGVAESVSVSAGGRSYRFRLRTDARWSNGDPLTAMDFVRGWHRALDPGTAASMAALLEPVAGARAVLAGEAAVDNLGIEAVSASELEVRLDRAVPWIAEILAHPVSFPLHASMPDRAIEAPVNGAYMIADRVPQSHVRLIRNPHFHSAETVGFAQVDYLPIEDPASELSRYRAGELDITETIPPGRFAWLSENLGEELRIAPYLGSFWLGLNLRREPFRDNPDLRLALALSLDRGVLTRIVLGAGEMPAGSLVPPGLQGYTPQAFAGFELENEARLAAARRHYRKAGYGDDRPLRLELRYNTSGQHRRMAVAVAAMWKQTLGVDTSLVNEEWKVFVNNRRQGVITQVFRGGWIADYADPTSFLDLYRQGSELNSSFYRNDLYDQLLQAASAREGRARTSLLEQAERVLMQDMPAIPLYYYVSRHLVKPRVSGFVDNVRDIHLSRWLEPRKEVE